MKRRKQVQGFSGIESLRTVGRQVWRCLIDRKEQLRLPQITFFDLQYKEKSSDFHFPKHSHDHTFEIYYVDRGRIRYSVKGSPLKALEQQQTLLLLPKIPHEVEGDSALPSNVITLHFNAPELLRLIPGLRNAAGRIIHFDAELYGMLNKLCATARSGAPAPGRRVAVVLAGLLQRLVQLAESDPAAGPAHTSSHSSQFVEQLEFYVKNHLQERLTLPVLAEAMGCSISTLTHEYQRLCGHSPHHLILLCRIERSKELLRHSDISVKEVAYLTGFSSQSAYGRSFLKMEKMTPGDYRRTLAAAVEVKPQAPSPDD